MSKYVDMEKDVRSNAEKLERGFTQINEWLFNHGFTAVVKNQIEREIQTIDGAFQISWRNTPKSSDVVVYGTMKKNGGRNKREVSVECYQLDDEWVYLNDTVPIDRALKVMQFLLTEIMDERLLE